MTIGTRIRNLRRARDLTQEELAEALGLTAKAVSGWECDRTSPDISQIPALCHYFHISADELLGIREEERRRVRDDTFSAAQLLAQNGEHMAAVEAFSAALARYPDDFEIMCALNYSVLVCIAQGKYAPARAEEERTLCAKRNERILANCTDDRIRYPAVSALARYYAEEGDLARAREMLSRLPDMADARNFVLPTLYTGDEAIRYEQELLFDVLHYIRRRMMRNFTTTAGTPFYTSAEMAQRYERSFASLHSFMRTATTDFSTTMCRMRICVLRGGKRKKGISLWHCPICAGRRIPHLRFWIIAPAVTCSIHRFCSADFPTTATRYRPTPRQTTPAKCWTQWQSQSSMRSVLTLLPHRNLKQSAPVFSRVPEHGQRQGISNMES